MMHTSNLESKEGFFLTPLSAQEIGDARRLCDECVGENLYGEEEIAATIDAQDKFFYLLKSETGETVGYIYWYLTDVESLARYTKLDASRFRSVCPDPNQRVGKIQSVGLRSGYRGIGLAAKMIRFVLKKMREISIDVTFIVCWKPGGVVPLGGTLGECQFEDLTEAKMVWYDDTELICPHCHGRCTCDAEVYYKLLNGETNNEA